MRQLYRTSVEAQRWTCTQAPWRPPPQRSWSVASGQRSAGCLQRCQPRTTRETCFCGRASRGRARTEDVAHRARPRTMQTRRSSSRRKWKFRRPPGRLPWWRAWPCCRRSRRSGSLATAWWWPSDGTRWFEAADCPRPCRRIQPDCQTQMLLSCWRYGGF